MKAWRENERAHQTGSALTRWIEAVGTQQSFMQAVHATRGGGHLGYVGGYHGVQIPGLELFFAAIDMLGVVPPRCVDSCPI